MNEKCVMCPFFLSKTWRKRNNGITITCEKIRDNMGFDVKNMLAFGTEKERKDWMDIFCTDVDNYKNCPYYVQIYKNYERKQ